MFFSAVSFLIDLMDTVCDSTRTYDSVLPLARCVSNGTTLSLPEAVATTVATPARECPPSSCVLEALLRAGGLTLGKLD